MVGVAARWRQHRRCRRVLLRNRQSRKRPFDPGCGSQNPRAGNMPGRRHLELSVLQRCATPNEQAAASPASTATDVSAAALISRPAAGRGQRPPPYPNGTDPPQPRPCRLFLLLSRRSCWRRASARTARPLQPEIDNRQTRPEGHPWREYKQVAPSLRVGPLLLSLGAGRRPRVWPWRTVVLPVWSWAISISAVRQQESPIRIVRSNRICCRQVVWCLADVRWLPVAATGRSAIIALLVRTAQA